MLLDETYYTEHVGAWFKCEVCEGKLHEPLECPTKKRLDAYAKANGDNANWGTWKWLTYYKALTEAAEKARPGL